MQNNQPVLHGLYLKSDEKACFVSIINTLRIVFFLSK
jgi:hypothetical protein